MLPTALKNLLFPHTCILCQAGLQQDMAICQPCLDDMPWHLEHTCPQCALPSLNNLHCGQCIQAPPAFNATFSLFQYQFPLSALLQEYKYRQLLTLAHALGTLVAARVEHQPPVDCILPMPLHPKRLQERGFNQSVEIARIASKQLDIAVDLNACKRIKATPPQASLPYKERIKNMLGAFECSSNLQGMRIALLDDVMTTGASLNALAKTVRSAGASHVECWVIARTFTQ